METRAQFAYSDLKAPPTDPVGPAVSIAGVASFGTLSEQPHGAPQQAVPGGQQSFPSARGARVACGRRFPLQRRHDHVSRVRSRRYTFSSLANFLSGVYNNAGFTQTFGETMVVADQSQRRGVRAGRVEGEPEPDRERRSALRPAVPGNDQHGHEQRLAAAGFRVVAVRFGAHGRARQRRTLLRPRSPACGGECAAVGWKHHRPQRSFVRSASALSPTQDGAPAFPNILSASVPTGDAGQPDDDGSEHAERVLAGRGASRWSSSSGSSSTVSVGYQYLRGAESDHGDESERADVRGGRHQQRLPPEPDLREQQPVFLGRGVPTITACTSRSCSGRRDGDTTGCRYTLSKSMNNVGEDFFSSPIDPFDLSKDWGRSDDDQRHRLVLNGAVNSSMEPADDAMGAADAMDFR